MAKRLSKYAKKLIDDYTKATKDYYVYSFTNPGVGGSDTVFKKEWHKAGAMLGQYIKDLEEETNND